MSLTPDTIQQWVGALGTLGGAVLVTWKYGRTLSGWCHLRWKARRTALQRARAAERRRAEDQAKALARIAELTTTLELKNLQLEWEQKRNADLTADLARARETITWQDTQIASLRSSVDGLPR